eukprot:Hpha_TRINITY_DN15746_c2_g3::TRINITY_DN15746_c2_g3_i2::g.39833::m.39833
MTWVSHWGEPRQGEAWTFERTPNWTRSGPLLHPRRARPPGDGARNGFEPRRRHVAGLRWDRLASRAPASLRHERPHLQRPLHQVPRPPRRPEPGVPRKVGEDHHAARQSLAVACDVVDLLHETQRVTLQLPRWHRRVLQLVGCVASQPACGSKVFAGQNTITVHDRPRQLLVGLAPQLRPHIGQLREHHLCGALSLERPRLHCDPDEVLCQLSTHRKQVHHSLALHLARPRRFQDAEVHEDRLQHLPDKRQLPAADHRNLTPAPNDPRVFPALRLKAPAVLVCSSECLLHILRPTLRTLPYKGTPEAEGSTNLVRRVAELEAYTSAPLRHGGEPRVLPQRQRLPQRLRHRLGEPHDGLHRGGLHRGGLQLGLGPRLEAVRHFNRQLRNVQLSLRTLVLVRRAGHFCDILLHAPGTVRTGLTLALAAAVGWRNPSHHKTTSVGTCLGRGGRRGRSRGLAGGGGR